MSGLGLFGMIFVGGLAGWIASLVLNQRRYLAANIAVGLVGSVGGDVVAHRLGAHILPGLATNLVLSAVGATLLLALFGLFHRRA